MIREEKKIVADWMPGNQWHHSIVETAVLLSGLSSVIFSYSVNPILLAPSGALLLISGVIVEYLHNSYEKTAINKSIFFSSGIGGAAIFKFYFHRKVMKNLAHAWVIIGTLLWAYSELVMERLSSV